MGKNIQRLIGSIMLLVVASLPFFLSSESSEINRQNGQRSFTDTANTNTNADNPRQVIVSDPVTPTLSPAVRDLPPYQLEYQLDREINPRLNLTGNPEINPSITGRLDPLLAIQAQAHLAAPSDFLTPTFNFDGQGFTSVNPPDTVGDVGSNHYIQMINGGGTSVAIYNKTTAALITQFALTSLGSCATGNGDPIVLYDEQADRWLLSEFGPGNSLCVFISQTADPTGAYFSYQFLTTNFPDYPKYGVWPDAYYVSTNEASPAAYAFDRTNMLAGSPATSQRFTAPDLSGFGFQALTPADLDGTLPPAGAPGIFMRHRDTEAHGNGNCSVIAGEDCLEIWAFDVDWVTPGNSSFTEIAQIIVTDFDSELCGFFAFACFPQPGSITTLDPLREVIMFRLQYRNFSSHQALVGNLVTDVDGTDHGGVRWFELRNSSGTWSLFQEGTYAPDVDNRWMGGSAMDASGNIAIGYNVSSGSTFPSLRYAGRLASDPLGTLPQGEGIIVAGAAANGSNRYGDYSAMSVDPVDGCTFWFTGQYNAATSWSTRIASFRFDQCGGTDFTLSAAPPSLSVCAPANAVYDISVGSLGGFNQAVALSSTGQPAPPNSVSFSVNNQPAPYTSTMTVGTAGATAGTYDIDVIGMGPTSTHTTTVELNLFTTAPSAPTLVTPGNGASGVSTSPTFEWTAVANASSYNLEVATDATFSTLVYTATVAAPATSHTAGTSLSANTVYYWRVTADNPCGSGPASTAFSFLTVNFFCSTPNLPISSGPHTDDMIITTTGTISDVNVSLDIPHTWVGDLIVAIEHVDTGTSVTIVDQPGAPPGEGCSGDDIDAILDDEAGSPVESACSSTPPAIGGTFSPNNPLDAFDGESLNGTWRISISDAFPTADDGILNEWCIIPELPGAPEIAVEPASLSSTQQPDTILTHTLTISNVGGGLLDWTVVEQNPSTFLETVTVATYPETAESAADLTPSMQAFLQDKEPVQNLQPMGATPCVSNLAGSYACSNMDLLSFLPLSTIGGGEGNDIWGWTGCNGREFALMGRTNGTSFVEITDPVNPVFLGNLPPHTGNSIWRDIKTYADHAFIVSEAGSHGMQVFDLTQLCSVTAPPVTFSETTHYNGFGNAHNLVINEDSGYAYGVGTSTCSGGLHMVNIQNPLSPSNAGCYSADGYTHDAQCVNYHGPDTEHQGKEICFNANVDTLTIVDVTNKATPAQLSRTGYIGSDYTHQGWLTEDHAHFLLDDEGDETGSGHNTRTYIWDLADLDNPLLIDNYTATTAAIDHNLYIKGNYAFEANYRAGLRILDIHDIANGNLFEEAYFDIYPGSDSASFNGAWSNYPYFDSSVVVVSGIEQGLYILQPTTLPGVCTSLSDIPWLTVSPTNGTTLENSSTPVNVIFDSTGLTPGEYTASLCIESNAVTMPQVQVPVTLTVLANQVPVAADDVYTTTQKMALSVAAPGVLSNDTDGDGQPLTAVLATGPSNGSLSLNADGSFIYTPTVGFTGSDSFTYRATDGINSSNVATVTINISNPQIFLPFVASDD